ncbi:lysozyme inhibitor LprI family protein [Sphingomonas sp. TDK1]|uniref:lysozyme inhibitor LprI family protein n=1 Tax=Sphingomonas sp. TDK1 TaxID=453247 RepID=UPI0007DA2169|nr:lysozyme inhibitor LprI family protein [Sphingomonas sp. TDK1]OAN66826.1 hypothetical protein A7X12_09380 [Sphingomonas sp. TDK1]
MVDKAREACIMFNGLMLAAMIFAGAPAMGQDAKQAFPPSYFVCVRQAKARFSKNEVRRDAAEENCAEDAFERRELILNATYESLRDSLPLERRTRLITLQRAWSNATEDKCWDQTARDRAEPYYVILYACKLIETDQRITWLRAQTHSGRSERRP